MDQKDEMDGFLESFDDSEKVTEETPEEVTEEATEEKSEEASKEAPKEDSKEDPNVESKMVPIAAVHDLRRKNQQLAEELDGLRKQVPDELEEPDPLEDPEEWKQWQRDKIVREANESKQREIADKIEASRSRALEKHENFEAMEDTFSYLAAKDPDLVKKMVDHEDPAEWAFRQAEKYEEDRKTELLAELESKLQKGEAKPEDLEVDSEKPVSTPSLATATAAKSNKVESESLGELKDELDLMFSQ